MKFNWGTGIFLFYSIFAASLFYQVFCSTKYSNDLVEDNYYEKDLAYQQRFERIENSLNLDNPLEIKLLAVPQVVQIDFPQGAVTPTGKVRFYRASDETRDLLLPVKIEANGHMLVSASAFLPGWWKVEVEWEMDGKPYFDTHEIFVGKEQ